MFRVAIIGGGPAGSAAAMALLRSAAPGSVGVRLFESKEFPRNKVCGEFVSPAAGRVLESLVGADRLHAAGARRVGTLHLHHGPKQLPWRMPVPAWTLSRMMLDQLLLDQAISRGADVRQPCHIREVRYTDSHAIITTGDGEVQTADLVIHADGCGRHDPSGETPARKRVIGLKCLLRPESPLDGLHMHAIRGAYVGAVGVERGLATVALVARTSLEHASIRGADALVRQVWPEFDASRRESEWLACPVRASGYITPGHPRSFRIGNAAAAVEPVGGEGIGLALWSGYCLGSMLGSRLRSAPDLGPAALIKIQAALARRYRRKLAMRLPACRAAAGVLMRPRLVSALWPILTVPGLVLAPWYALTGKPLRASAET